jgi:hypothetical protein
MGFLNDIFGHLKPREIGKRVKENITSIPERIKDNVTGGNPESEYSDELPPSRQEGRIAPPIPIRPPDSILGTGVDAAQNQTVFQPDTSIRPRRVPEPTVSPQETPAPISPPDTSTRQRYSDVDPNNRSDVLRKKIENRRRFIDGVEQNVRDEEGNVIGTRTAPENKPSRKKAFFGTFLENAGASARDSLANAARTGRPVDSTDFFSAIAGGVTSGTRAAIRPKEYADRQNEKDIAKSQAELDQITADESQQADVGYRRARAVNEAAEPEREKARLAATEASATAKAEAAQRKEQDLRDKATAKTTQEDAGRKQKNKMAKAALSAEARADRARSKQIDEEVRTQQGLLHTADRVGKRSIQSEINRLKREKRDLEQKASVTDGKIEALSDDDTRPLSDAINELVPADHPEHDNIEAMAQEIEAIEDPAERARLRKKLLDNLRR